MAHEPRFLAAQPPQMLMQTVYTYILLARGPQLIDILGKRIEAEDPEKLSVADKQRVMLGFLLAD